MAYSFRFGGLFSELGSWLIFYACFLQISIILRRFPSLLLHHDVNQVQSAKYPLPE